MLKKANDNTAEKLGDIGAQTLPCSLESENVKKNVVFNVLQYTFSSALNI